MKIIDNKEAIDQLAKELLPRHNEQEDIVSVDLADYVFVGRWGDTKALYIDGAMEHIVAQLQTVSGEFAHAATALVQILTPNRESLKMADVEAIMSVINSAGQNVNVIWGASIRDDIAQGDAAVFIVYGKTKPETNLERFVEAQNGRWAGYDRALREIAEGRKCSHWMWYIFPQLRGLGHSDMSYFYGITDIDEAVAYMRHPILGPRLREITGVLRTHRGKSAGDIFGVVDAMKLHSCLTLFDAATASPCFGLALMAFFDNQRCEKTLSLIQAYRESLIKRFREL